MSVTLTLSCAVSSDGYLDDTSPERAVLSSAEDLEAVLALRAQMDVIVIGAETLRRDDPSLATRGRAHFATRQSDGRASHPVKVVVTRSGVIPETRKFFVDGDGEKLILSGNFETGHALLNAIKQLADERDLSDVLVEGGASILRLLMPVARYFRLAVSPETLGLTGHARLFDDMERFLDPLVITSTEKLGDTTVHHIDLLLSRAKPLMEKAFELSENCPPSETAYAVGAMGCDEDLTILATGFSRETDVIDHAEEALLAKLDTPPHTVICTLEPCLTRASKPKGCSQRLVEAGVERVIYAVEEDGTFTQQAGLSYLRNHGIDILHLPGFEALFRTVNPLIYGAA